MQALPAISNTIVVLAAIAITVFILRTFLSFKKTSKTVYFATFVGYFCSIVLLFLIPLDVGVATYEFCVNRSSLNQTNFDNILEEENPIQNNSCKKPFNYVAPRSLEIVWAILYWVTYVATWVLYPLLQSYVLSGEFTFGGRVKAALKENLLFAAIALGVVGIIFLILYLVAGRWEDSVIDAAITAGSMWGIFVLISLLGYGLIFVPRKYWRKANRKQSLQHLQSKLAQYYDEIEDHGYQLDQTLKLIKKYDTDMPEDDPHRGYLNEILRHLPEEYGNLTTGEGELKTSYSDLVDLNTKVQWDVHQYNTSRVLFEETFKQGAYIEDILQARQNDWTRRVDFTLREPRTGCTAPLWNSLEYIWTIIAPVYYRFIAVMFALMSLTLVYSEMVFFKFPNVSFYAFIVTKLTKDPLLLQSICFLMVSYLGLCTYSALFKLKLFWFYRLLPHQQTDENSILFSAAFMSRLVAPLYLNFLHVINLATYPSPFLKIMKTDPIREAVYQYFPLILLVFCIFTLFNLANKLMKLCGLNQVCCTDDFDDDQIERGSEILFREREAKQRQTSTIRRIAGVGRLSKPSMRNYPVPPKLDRTSSARTSIPSKEPVLIELDDLRDNSPRGQDAPARQPTFLQKAFSWFGEVISPAHSVINATDPPQEHHHPPSRLSRDSSSDENPAFSHPRDDKIQFREIRTPFTEPMTRSEVFRPQQSHNPFDGVKSKPAKKYAWEDSDSD